MSERNWTPAQREAIDKNGCNLLVSAGAGSGKTAVLIQRIIKKITDPDEPINIDQLLVVTFTNAAAAEMRQRLGIALNDLIENDPENRHLLKQAGLLDQAYITTLHSFCLDLIRKNFYRLDLDASFRVAGDFERQIIYQETLENFIEEQYEKENALLPILADCYGGNKDDRGLIALIFELYDFSMSQPDPKKWLEEAAHTFASDSLDDYPWSKFWQEEIKKKIAQMQNHLKEAMESSCFSQIPLGWQECFSAEEAGLRAFISSDIGLSSLMDNLYDFEFCRLPSSKSDPGDKEAKEYCRKHREVAKSTYKKTKKQFFPRSSQELFQDMLSLKDKMFGLMDLVFGYSQALSEAKRRRNLIDYSDMEHFCLKLLCDEENGVREQLKKDFKEILVDEYQDINGVQNCILEMVAAEDNLFMVGDIKQSIYGFRLAEPELFLDKFYKYKEGLGGWEIDLTSNFRSTRSIIEAVNFIFSQLMAKDLAGIDYDESAKLKAGREDSGIAPEVYLLNYLSKKDREELLSRVEEDNSSEDIDNNKEDEAMIFEDISKISQEARFIAGKIWQTVEEGYAFRDIVILLRSVKNKEDIMIEELSRAGIPVCGSDQGSSPTNAEIDLLISLLQVIDNPLQDIPLAAVLYSPLVGIDLDGLLTMDKDRNASLYQALVAFVSKENEEDSDDKGKVANFLESLRKWRIMSKKMPVSELLNTIYHDTGFYYLAGALPGGKYRYHNLLDFYELAKAYDNTSFKGLFRFITFIEEIRENGQELTGGSSLSENENVVRVMSIHKSKGLEFPVVFLAGLGDTFNLRPKNSDMVFDQEYFWGPKIAFREERVKYPTLAYQVINYKKRQKALAEEMRILYVAMTRAKEKLILTASLRKLDESIKKWTFTALDYEPRLPESVIAEDMRYIDWLGRALLRHPEAEAMRRIAEEERQVTTIESDSRFKIEIIDDGVFELGCIPLLSTQSAGAQETNALWENKSKIKEILEYSYPYRAISDFPAKWTVTEIQKTAYDREYYEQTNILISDDISEDNNSPLLRGSVYHRILELLNLNNVYAPEEIDKQIMEFMDKGYILREELNLIETAAIKHFFTSTLGKRLLRAKRVERELKFTYALPAFELKEEAVADDRIILQGMIDLAFFEDTGWVIIDYKTGGRNLSSEDIKRKYALQLQYYSRALQGIFNNPVNEAYLYMLDDGRLISLSG